jgi:hypothetical protein
MARSSAGSLRCNLRLVSGRVGQSGRMRRTSDVLR